MRSRLDAIRLAAIEDRIQVHLEDLALRIVLIELEGQHRLFGFALDRIVRVGTDEELLDQLLTDRAATLLDAAVRIVGKRRPHDGTEVDATIGIEAVVLDGDGGVDDVGRDVAERDNYAMVTLVADIGKQAAVPVEDQHVLRQAC